MARALPATGPSTIRRKDLQREVRISAMNSGRSLGEVAGDIERAAATLELPPGYDILPGGDSEELKTMFSNMLQTLALAIIFIYLILASQFGSFLHPFAIMLSLPLSLVGVALALLATGDTLNMMSMIGLIMLMGLVTKNAILLIDFTNQARAAGTPRDQALIKAGSTRLRPIVMTTLAMIFGMLPLAFAIGAGAEMRAPMARAVIGGLITSTLLTLVVVPVVYTYLDGLRPETVRAWLAVPRAARRRRTPPFPWTPSRPATEALLDLRGGAHHVLDGEGADGAEAQARERRADLRPVAHHDEGRPRRVDGRRGGRLESLAVDGQGLRDEPLEEAVGQVVHDLLDHPGRHLGGRLEVARVAEGRVAAGPLHFLGRGRRPDPVRAP